jgi:hypothetical protein
MSSDSASFLLYVLLILSGVALFLCILNLLSLRDLSRRIRKIREVSGGPKHDKRVSFPPDLAGGQEGEAGLAYEGDITSGINLIAKKYRLDSLTVASSDGLVVASAGSGDPEFEAAYYTDILSRNAPIPENGVRLFEFAYLGMALVGIARARNLPPKESEQQMKADIWTVFETQFGQNAGISGEII